MFSFPLPGCLSHLMDGWVCDLPILHSTWLLFLHGFYTGWYEVCVLPCFLRIMPFCWGVQTHRPHRRNDCEQAHAFCNSEHAPHWYLLPTPFTLTPWHHQWFKVIAEPLSRVVGLECKLAICPPRMPSPIETPLFAPSAMSLLCH
jgi:hypothetical protein